MNMQDTSLTLFFTGGMNLKIWAKTGNLDREVELYKALSTHLKSVNFVTYGKEDRSYLDKHGKIKVLTAKWYGRRELTIIHLLLKHCSEILNSDVFKTDQIYGSEIPVWLKKKFKKKLITRCGYLLSQFIKREFKNKKEIMDAYKLERDAFSHADVGVVTSARDREYVIKEHKIKPEKIKVIPNYVITNVFRHIPVPKLYDLVYVGRGDSQKNLKSLLRAINYLKTNGKEVSLLMIGSCCEEDWIRLFIKKEDLEVTFKGPVPNFELPSFLNQAKIFILPSYYEGHSKALLEAMSCGLPCIGTNVEGIREELNHQHNGYLCKTDFKSIAEAIETVLFDEMLQKKVGKNARKHIIKNYSFKKISKIELEAIQEVLT